MTNQQAEAKAKKRWGKSYGIRNSGHFSSSEQRDSAYQSVVAARTEIKRIEEEIAARLKELDWYQELLRQRRTHRDQISKTEGNAHHYRFTTVWQSEQPLL